MGTINHTSCPSCGNASTAYIHRDGHDCICQLCLESWVEDDWCETCQGTGYVDRKEPLTSSKIYKIALTGGPCAGKTTSLSRLREYFGERGYRVFTMPEVATMFFSNGIGHSDAENRPFHVQQAMLSTQLAMEDRFIYAASALPGEKGTIILFDRGAFDVKCYTPDGMWSMLLSELSLNEAQLMNRYDAVIHMVTVAEGKPEFYTKDNNASRRESVDEAVLSDRRTQDCWRGHGHFRIIDNSTDLEGKIRRVISSVCNTVGIPEPLEQERKFLVDASTLQHLISDAHVTQIEQVYLSVGESGPIERVRKREYPDGSFSYTHTVKKPTDKPGVNYEVEEIITARDYVEMCSTHIFLGAVKKKRTCFIYEGRQYELDQFENIWDGKMPFTIRNTKEQLCLLEVEVEDIDEDFMPNFPTIEEVTGDEFYSNLNIARYRSFFNPFTGDTK